MNKEIKIKVYSDYKERFDSFEASIEGFNENEVAYGETEKEAVEELKKIIQKKIIQLNNLL